MTDITNVTATDGKETLDEREKAVMAYIHQYHDVLDKNKMLSAQVDQQERQLAIMHSEVEMLKGQIEQISSSRDHYMRHSVELVTRLNDIGAVIVKSMTEAKQHAYRPNGNVAATQIGQEAVEKALDPVPQFLTKDEDGRSSTA